MGVWNNMVLYIVDVRRAIMQCFHPSSLCHQHRKAYCNKMAVILRRQSHSEKNCHRADIHLGTVACVFYFPYFWSRRAPFQPSSSRMRDKLAQKASFDSTFTRVYFFLPVTVMLIAYAIIYKEVRRNSRRISALESAGNQGSRSNVLKREMKAVKTLAVVVGMFFIMWMPYFVTTTIRAFRGDDAIPGVLQRTVITLAYGNSCCNFVIYALMNAQLRNAFYRILKECCGTREARIDLNSTRGLNLTTVSRNRRAEAPMESKEKYRRD